MPNKKNLRLWVKALRSGAFGQGTGVLRDVDDQYCCLGVACEVAMANGVELDRRLGRETESLPPVWLYENTSSVLPKEVMDWLGVHDCDPIVGENNAGERCSASTANDALGWSFIQIANALELHYGLNEEW